MTRRFACGLLTALVTIVCATSAPAGAKPRSGRVPQLVFGIYPGGGAGTVGPSGPTRPDDPSLRLVALEQLRPPGRPFVLHLYALYTGSGGRSADQQVGQEVEAYGQARFQTEVVLGYRPADGGSLADVHGFVGFVESAVQSLGTRPGLTSLQVTNEANVGGSPDTSDGYYAGAKDALIAGVLAAKAEVRRDGLNGIDVGFNWAAGGDRNERAFWRYLGRHGGRAIRGRVGLGRRRRVPRDVGVAARSAWDRVRRRDVGRQRAQTFAVHLHAAVRDSADGAAASDREWLSDRTGAEGSYADDGHEGVDPGGVSRPSGVQRRWIPLVRSARCRLLELEL